MTKVKRDDFLREPRQNRVIVCEELDFTWERKELNKLARMWKKGQSILEMAVEVERDPDEVLIALIHLAKKNKVEKREGGLFGH